MYPNIYNPQLSVDRINQQIQELERMKNGYQQMQQPTNIINVGNSLQNDFKAQYLNENEKVEDILVQCKTAFISPKNGYLKIKDINGDITEYILKKPKTEQELYIEQLERKVNEYESILNPTNIEINESGTNDINENDTGAKKNSRTILKKPK